MTVRFLDTNISLRHLLNDDPGDAYHAALIENRGEQELYSYDADFDRISGLHRLEP